MLDGGCVGVLALVLVCGVAVGSPASSKRALLALAARLAAQDPGAVVGGYTIVATGDSAWVVGVPHRPNFIFALGPNEVVFAGQGRNVIRALAANVTVHAGSGSTFVWGGPGATLIGGSGRDMLTDTGPRAAVWVRSATTVAVLYGRRSRVLCSRRARGALIYVAASDSVGSMCRAVHARVLPVSRVHGAPTRLRVGASQVTGDGSNDNPYVALCDDPQDADCTVSGFSRRLVDGWPNGEFVPAYRCPPDHPYRSIYNFIDGTNGPFGWTVGPGVGIQEDWGDYPIGVSITGESDVQDPGLPSGVLWTGTKTGFPNSSASNWNYKAHWYRVVLHCTSNRCHGTSQLEGDRGGLDPNNGDPPGNCSSATAERFSRLLAKPAAARATASSIPALHHSPSAPRAGPRRPPL